MNIDDLASVRREIDMLDQEIIKTLNKRMEIAVWTKKFKGTLEDLDREKEVIANVRGHSHNLIKPDFSERLFTEIIKESKRLQSEKMQFVGFQGEHGAYSEIAALTYNPSLTPIPCTEFADVFKAVETGHLDFGIVPVENSLEGVVAQVNDLLVETNLKIVSELWIPIHHNLLALPGSNYRDMKSVYSHPQALSQCCEFIRRNKLEPHPFYDTAGAAKMLAKEREEKANSAVIASALCAELYGLEIIKENIENHESNSTRFFVLAKNPSNENGNKCSIIFSTKHEAGALFKILKIFSDADINLTRIESRRTLGGQKKYAFLLDFQGSDKNDDVKNVLANVEKNTITYKFLGCYKEHIDSDLAAK